MLTNQAEYRVLVIGKAGTGKSALCNTIVGQDKFPVGRSMSTTTTTAQSETVYIHGCRIKVIDTPDITNCGMNPTQRIEEVSKWKYMASDNPSAVLLAVRGDVRYTAEEYSVYSEICSLWGGDVLKKKLLVAFTCGDNLDEDIVETVKHPPPELGKILRAAKSATSFLQTRHPLIDRCKPRGSCQSWKTWIKRAVSDVLCYRNCARPFVLDFCPKSCDGFEPVRKSICISVK